MTDPRAPAFWIFILGIVLITAIVRLLPQLTQKSEHNWTLPIAVLFLAWQVARVTPIASPVHRMILLIISVLGVLICLWAAREVDSGTAGNRKIWPLAIELGGRLAAGLLLASVFANVIGSVGLATFIADGIMYAIFGVILVLLVVQVLQGLVQVSLLTQTARRFNVVRSRSDSIWAVFSRLIRWLGVSAWIYIVLTGFLIIDPIVAFIKNFLETNISVGQLALSPEDVFLFVLVIWLSYKLSQFIRFVLETAVLPHMHLPRGVPAAITTLTNYAVIVIGVMVAMSVAGFDMSRVTLIFGALGVGVGFGLQNIVNNFISGLILLFERPIKVGDIIEINNELAVVKHIAMRASTVRTYEGAMIIVPNANLISAEVVNWTYGTDKRRMEIPVGVAYGTDPKTVIELLIDVAKSHPDVSETPEPSALFLRFGDSSLDFELRVWVSVSSRMKIISDLLLAITEALAEAGITIPFPQRDLHLQSVADSALLIESQK
jgi:small-conductance mechanosensitive channel